MNPKLKLLIDLMFYRILQPEVRHHQWPLHVSQTAMTRNFPGAVSVTMTPRFAVTPVMETCTVTAASGRTPSLFFFIKDNKNSILLLKRGSFRRNLGPDAKSRSVWFGIHTMTQLAGKLLPYCEAAWISSIYCDELSIHTPLSPPGKDMINMTGRNIAPVTTQRRGGRGRHDSETVPWPYPLLVRRPSPMCASAWSELFSSTDASCQPVTNPQSQ